MMKIFLSSLVLLLCVGAPAGTALESKSEVTPETILAIDKGLDFLVSQQSARGGFNGSAPVAATSMACLAFMAHGDTLTHGKYAPNLQKGMEFILRSTSRTGFISENNMMGASGMHGHGFATLFLAEVLGMVQDRDLNERVQDTLRRAVRLIEGTQNRFGGWNASPNGQLSDDGSGAVAIMQIMALRSARNAGIKVDEGVIKKAKKYLLEMTTPDGWYQYNYNSRSGHRSSALTGAGIYMLGAFDLYQNPKYDKGIRNLMSAAPFLKGKPGAAAQYEGGDQGWQGWYFYTCFYASLAIFQHGDEPWKKWYPAMRDDLLKRQEPAGSWPDSYGGLFTAFCVLSLEMPYRYLPVFQSGGRGAEGF